MVWVGKLFMNILLWILKFIDTLFEIFKILAGAERGDDGRTVIDVFLQADIVSKIFLGLLLLGIFIAFVCVVVAIIKNTAKSSGERKSHAKSVGQGFMAVFTTLVLAMFMYIGIAATGTALVQVNKLFTDEDKTFGTIIFMMCVEDTYEEIIVEKLDENGEIIESFMRRDIKRSGWYWEYYAEDFTIEGKTANDIFGNFRRSMFVFEDSTVPLNTAGLPLYKGGRLGAVLAEADDAENFEYIGTPSGLIRYGSFNYLIGYFAAIVLLVVLIIAMLGLVKRLYDIVLLFLALPLIAGTVPLDDGAKLKAWREAVVSKVVLAFGAIFAVNVFLIIVPMAMGLSFGEISPVAVKALRLFMVLGGGLSITGGQILFARLFGTSAEESREMTQALRGMIAGGAAAGGMAKGASNRIFGGRSKYGVQHKGLLRGGGKALAATGNVAGSVVAGNAYRRSATAVKGWAARRGADIKRMGNAYMRSGGLAGMLTRPFRGPPISASGVGSVPGADKSAATPAASNTPDKPSVSGNLSSIFEKKLRGGKK
ncbi:MAG: hypothetical protein FWH03_02685 [Firmicutes bacterium]|nr:hypothetical protein [Bacillota bacterium]